MTYSTLIEFYILKYQNQTKSFMNSNYQFILSIFNTRNLVFSSLRQKTLYIYIYYNNMFLVVAQNR